jgi:hypothetical protein
MEVPPPLWHFRCPPVANSDFVSWNFAGSGVTVAAYRNGLWPADRFDEVQPAPLSKHCMRVGRNNIIIVICPLCYDVSVFEPTALRRDRHYECPGHNGSAFCPGFVYGTPASSESLSPGATCSIQ